MVTITKIGEEYNSQILEISGLSTDPKPVDHIDGVFIANGSTFKEIDTGKEYTYNESAETWHINKSASSGGTGSGVNGKDGITPHIGENGNWFIGTVDTEVPAQGPAGENGVTPHIGTNENWYIGSTDTGVSAKGVKGDTGEPGAKGDKGDTGAQGEPGKDGSDGNDGISATHSWNGTVLSITSASGTSSVDLKGEKGDTGAKGDTGSQGEKGDPGADGGHYAPIVTQPTSDTMQISFAPSKSDMPAVNPVIVNLPVSENSGQNPGQDGEDGATFTPAVSEDGTLSWSNDKGLENPAPVNIKGPQGEQGPKGDTGATGPAGADGAKGEKGDRGEQGLQGIPGEKGDTGAPGADGAKGDKGDKGDTGPAGANGAQGPKGDQGEPGKDGADGAPGKDGVSATHSWNGTTLTITSASGISSADLKGAKGDKGDKGDTGATGPQGEKGDTGPQGPKGDKGDTGATGPAGADGYTPQRGVDYWNPADKAEIVAMVIESLGGNPIFGTVDENNNIIVSGDLPDGTYSVKYEMANGTTVNIGNLVLDTNVYFTITNTLTNCTNSNSATKAVQGGSYSATITAKSGYELKSVTATMGGSAITVSGGKINITNVTGNIVITAVAEEIKVNYTNLADPTSADWLENTRISSSGFPTQTGITTSNWIAVTTGDVLRIKGIDVNTHQYARVALFGSTKNLLSSAKVSGLTAADATGITYDTTGAQFTIASANAKYVRICGELKGDVIITKNEPIE